MPLTVPAQSFAYDVFISYRHHEPDLTWVRTTLLPRLRVAGLKVCIDYDCFRLGAPLVLEMARAVEQSRYTVAVLSPAYLRNFATSRVFSPSIWASSRANAACWRSSARPAPHALGCAPGSRST